MVRILLISSLSKMVPLDCMTNVVKDWQSGIFKRESLVCRRAVTLQEMILRFLHSLMILQSPRLSTFIFGSNVVTFTSPESSTLWSLFEHAADTLSVLRDNLINC